jgi:dTDP-4-dehydrorhamnose reductase
LKPEEVPVFLLDLEMRYPDGMRICVTGARGMLGQQVVAMATSLGHTVIPWVRPETDIAQLESLLERGKEDKPDSIVNCAAWTDVDGAETNTDAAYLTNHVGAENVALLAESLGIRLVHVSTDFVYPGDIHRPLIESDATGPKSVYGSSKLAGEAAVRKCCPNAVVIRTGYIFGHHGPNLIDKIAAGIRSGYTMPFVTDQWITPTGTPLLAAACLKFCLTDAAGIFHVTQGGGCSTYEMAHFIAQLSSGTGSVTTTTLDEWEPIQSARCHAAGRQLAKRPIYSVLDTEKYYRFANDEPVAWQDAIRSHLLA